MSTRPSQPLAARLRAQERLTGLFAKMPCPAQIESAAYAGFDTIVLDTEHGPADALELEHHLRAADAAGIPALVRVPVIDPARILAALDAGAAGVVVPHVLDAEGARAVVAAAHYPPRGRRGLALSTRAGRYGSIPVTEHLQRAVEETVVIVQIEDAEAVPRAGDILGVPGIDGVLIGATDLSISLGHPGEPTHPDIGHAIQHILAAAGNQAATAVVVGSPNEARDWSLRGVTLTLFVASQLIHDAFAGVIREMSPRDGASRSPLLLLPGTLGGWDTWADVAQALADIAAPRLARIDLDDSIAAMAETILASAPDRFALAGHSQGAIVALEIARRAPQRATRLALLNTTARPPTDEQRADWEMMRTKAQNGSFDEVAHEFAIGNLPPARRNDMAVVTRMVRTAMQVGPDGMLRQLTAQLTRPDIRPFLSAITCPTLVIAAVDDHICPPELQNELAAGIPRARLQTIDRSGHMSPLEAPERVAALLRDWLA